MFKFSQLNEKAKAVAVHDYHEGLIEGREWSEDVGDIPTFEECWDLCADTENDVLYSADGKMTEEGE